MKKGQYSETLERGLSLLNLFNEGAQALSLTEIARKTGINKTSVYRFVNTFCELGYLRRDTQSKLLKLGPRTLALAHSFISGSDWVQLVKPLVDEVHRLHRIHIDVGLLHGDSIYVVYRREAEDTLSYRHFINATGLHFLATGKAALAFLPQDEMETLLDKLELTHKTAKTIVDKKALLKDLNVIRQKGYSLNNEEFIPGLIAIGAPLYNLYTAKVVGGVSFDVSTQRMKAAELEENYAGVLTELAKKLSALIPAS